ncbi:MAG: hypothetical protein ABIT01_09835 [Thermoanaerobaculia bacterium]
MNEAYAQLRSRWAEGKALQDSELRQLTPDQRFDQLVDLFALRPALRDDPQALRELGVVRQRWAKLRRRHRALV